jgi:hypothetical protein
MLRNRLSFLFTVALLFHGLMFAAAARGALNDWDSSNAVSADGLGNVYITGVTVDALTSASGRRDAFISKFDVVGDLQWTRKLAILNNNVGRGVSADGLGNVYISGETNDSSTGRVDAFVSKYDAAGSLQWTKLLGTNLPDESTGVSADGLGNVYISGSTWGSLGGPNTGHNTDDVFVSKYDVAGDLQWTRQLGLASDDDSTGVSADGLGNVYISGSTNGSLGASNAGNYDTFVSKYDAAGNLQWTRQIGTNLWEYSGGVSADGLGNVYISGSTNGSLAGTSAGRYDTFVAKYDAAGNLQWTKQLVTSQEESTRGVSADGLGNVFISGFTIGSLGGSNNDDAFVSKYDAAGNLHWTRQLGTDYLGIAYSDQSHGVSADGLGNAYISGWLKWRNAFVSKYDAAGNFQWTGQLRDNFIIPEPASWLLIALAGIALLGTCRRRNTKFARSFVPLLCAIAILGVAGRADAGTLYAGTGGAHGELYILDPNTGGVLRDVGPLNDAAGRNYPMEGLAFQPGTGVLFCCGLLTLGCIRRRAPAGALLCAGMVLALVAPPAHAQTLEWVRQFGMSHSESSDGVSADGLGNVYISGSTDGSLGAPNAGALDAFVSKYDAAGNLQWTRQLGTSSEDESYGVSADGLGNVYITGKTVGSLGGPHAGGYDAFVSKYDSGGNLKWTSQIGASHDEHSTGVSADGLGNVFITGPIYNLTGDPDEIFDNMVFVSKFDVAGNLQWMRQFGSEYCFGISADGLGNAYITGYTSDENFLAKYDSAGNLQWTKQFGTLSPKAVSADLLGNVYISGGTYVTDNSDAFVSKYDSAGNLQWTSQLGTSSSDVSNGVSADGLGSVYISGRTSGSLGGPHAGNGDAFVTKYDAAGALQWTRQLGTTDLDRSHGASADGLGNVYISGVTNGSLGGPNAGSADPFVAKFNDCPDCEPPPVPPIVVDVNFGDILQGSLVTHQFTTSFGDLPVTWSNLVSYKTTVNPPTLSETGLFSWQTSKLDVGSLYHFDVTATNAGGSDTGRLTLRLAIIPEPTAIALLALGIGTSLFVPRARRRVAFSCETF